MTEPLTYTSLCSALYCPAPSNPDWHRCFVCGALEIQHHHVEPRSQAPSRVMDKTNIVALCNEHHELIGMGELIDQLEDGVYTVTEDEAILCCVEQGTGEIVASRSLTESVEWVQEAEGPLKSLLDNLVVLTDEGLAHLWAQEQQHAESAFIGQCAIAYTYHERWGGHGDAWAVRAARVIRDTDGIPCSPSTVRDRASAAIALMAVPSPEEFLANVGITITVAVGKADDPASAAEYALAQRDEGRQMTKIADEISEKHAALYSCPECGFEGERKEFKHVKEKDYE